MRYFIFFFMCQNGRATQHGQQGVAGKKLPRSELIIAAISDNNTYLPSQCAILGFNEVSEEDYNSFFDKKGSGE
jgi:hypothetical protein